ncbi:hypothetical protein E2C01_084551 [Portunus trituberculatus]|uniref:Uncharacterized protein n=1 Tax=Portunus trituberculatus TaxID=210409 RepID=A0A5B7J7V1_PORTR|nr:hypothetical protein [Portunus trituberculatus]
MRNTYKSDTKAIFSHYGITETFTATPRNIFWWCCVVTLDTGATHHRHAPHTPAARTLHLARLLVHYWHWWSVWSKAAVTHLAARRPLLTSTATRFLSPNHTLMTMMSHASFSLLPRPRSDRTRYSTKGFITNETQDDTHSI